MVFTRSTEHRKKEQQLELFEQEKNEQLSEEWYQEEPLPSREEADALLRNDSDYDIITVFVVCEEPNKRHWCRIVGVFTEYDEAHMWVINNPLTETFYSIHATEVMKFNTGDYLQ